MDDTHIIKQVHIVNNDKMARVSMQYRDDFIQQQVNVNVTYAAITTLYARLKLYEAMEIVGPRSLLYKDTDSNIFSYPLNKSPIVTGLA